ncbi:hypothetical protein M8J76_011526 [Diaphorina citri]|nr:hypothetical protein M8J76_011526 [Diaphorina citri]
MQTIIPPSPEELAIQTHVYRTKHPERVVLANMKIPFIDETESYYYEVIIAVQICLGFFYIVTFTMVVTLIPGTVNFMEAQYIILCQHIKNLDADPLHSHYDLFQMQTLFTPIMIPFFFCNNIAFSLCLYQLTDRPGNLSRVRIFKFLLEFITLTIQYFFLNNSSEVGKHLST